MEANYSEPRMSDQWFVHSNDQQMGPYTGEQLVEFAQQGNINAETMVWAEGMAEWLPASQIEGLIPAAAPEAATAPTQTAVQSSAAWAPPGARAAAGKASSAYQSAQAGGEYPYFTISPASFGLWLGSFVGGFVLLIISLLMLGSAGISAASEMSAGAADEEVADGAIGKATIVGILFIVSSGIMMLSGIFFLMNLHRAWKCLQPGRVRTTPGKAVGFLFVPIFNIYWLFVAFAGLAKDWNRVVSSHENLARAPRLSETTFLLYAIGSLIFPPLGLITMFMVVSQMCKGINYFASRRDPNAPSSALALPSHRALG